MRGELPGLLGLCLTVAVLASPAAFAADQAQQTPPRTLQSGLLGQSDDKAGGRGGEVFRTVCAPCHDHGVNGAPSRATLAIMSTFSIHKALTEGAMRGQAQGLGDDDKVLVAEYLTGKKLGTGPEIAGPPACTGQSAKLDVGEPPVFTGWGVSLDNARNIPIAVSGLDRSTLAQLTPRWVAGFPDAVSARSEPALAGGALFVGSHNGTVYALDRKSGCARWTFHARAEIRTGIVVSPWTADDKAADPLVYFGDLVGNVYALRAKTGEVAWQAHADPHPSATITAAPTLYGNRLYVSVSSYEEAMINPKYDCCTFRGSVVSYDARTGERAWQTFMTDPAVQRGVSPAGAKRLGPAGAAIWNSPAIDEKRHVLYVGTGDNYSQPTTATSDAAVALDLKTGKIAWSYQATAKDAWNVSCQLPGQANCPADAGPDYDIGAAVVLAKGSDGHDLLVVGQKSGMVSAIDPDTHKLVWHTKVGRGGVMAGVYFGMAVSDDTVFVPVSDVDDGRHYDEKPHPGLYALDLKTGAYRWKQPQTEDTCHGRPQCALGIGAAVTVTGDMVLAGYYDGWIRIHDARDGHVLWAFDTARGFPAVGGGTASGGSIGGGAGPLAYKGTLIVPSGYSFTARMPGNALLLLGGTPTAAAGTVDPPAAPH